MCASTRRSITVCRLGVARGLSTRVLTKEWGGLGEGVVNSVPAL